MASPAQIAANRGNATRSTGPADTSHTRFNGIAHGLTSKQTVIRGESQQEYNNFAAKLRQDLKPGTAVESVLADRVIAAAWRLQRFTRVEAAFFNNRIDAILESNPDSDPDAALATLFTDPAEMARMRLFLRYQTATQREYDTAMRELKNAQAERAESEQESASVTFEDLYVDKDPEIGFASQPNPESANTTPRSTVVSIETPHAL